MLVCLDPYHVYFDVVQWLETCTPSQGVQDSNPVAPRAHVAVRHVGDAM